MLVKSARKYSKSQTKMYNKHCTAAIATLALYSAAVSAQSECGPFSLSAGGNPLQLATNGTVTLARLNSTDAASDFSIAINGAITSRLNDTIVECGFSASRSYFECATVPDVESRESDDALEFDFATGDEGRLSWHGNDDFLLCNAVDAGYASTDLPAWDVIIASASSTEVSEQGCLTVQVTASNCEGFSAEGEENENDGADAGDDSDSTDSTDNLAVGGSTGGRGSAPADESRANKIGDWWTASAAVIGCLLSSLLLVFGGPESDLG
jgi:hypothetical protein